MLGGTAARHLCLVGPGQPQSRAQNSRASTTHRSSCLVQMAISGRRQYSPITSQSPPNHLPRARNRRDEVTRVSGSPAAPVSSLSTRLKPFSCQVPPNNRVSPHNFATCIPRVLCICPAGHATNHIAQETHCRLPDLSVDEGVDEVVGCARDHHGTSFAQHLRSMHNGAMAVRECPV